MKFNKIAIDYDDNSIYMVSGNTKDAAVILDQEMGISTPEKWLMNANPQDMDCFIGCWHNSGLMKEMKFEIKLLGELDELDNSRY